MNTNYGGLGHLYIETTTDSICLVFKAKKDIPYEGNGDPMEYEFKTICVWLDGELIDTEKSSTTWSLYQSTNPGQTNQEQTKPEQTDSEKTTPEKTTPEQGTKKSAKEQALDDEPKTGENSLVEIFVSGLAIISLALAVITRKH